MPLRVSSRPSGGRAGQDQKYGNMCDPDRFSHMCIIVVCAMIPRCHVASLQQQLQAVPYRAPYNVGAQDLSPDLHPVHCPVQAAAGERPVSSVEGNGCKVRCRELRLQKICTSLRANEDGGWRAFYQVAA